MSFHIDRGLFKLDFTDHHAVLGISVDADVKEVRKRYLKIARNLHPDSCKAETEAQKKQANQLLSKLVNPAYEQLSQSNKEYLVSLGHLGRRLATEGAKIPVASEAAKQLSKAGANLDHLYKTSLQNLASKQYESLDQVLDKIAEISELNMVYLMLKGGKGEGIRVAGGGVRPTSGSVPGTPPTAAGVRPGTPPTTSSVLPDSGGSRIDTYLRRAEGHMMKNNFAAAVLELREALKIDQNNSSCHSLLGIAYLKQNQATMAKVHITKALQVNPKDERALKGKEYLDKLAQKNSATTKPSVPSKQAQSKPSDKSDKSGKSDKPGSGGLFGGLFGGKKK